MACGAEYDGNAEPGEEEPLELGDSEQALNTGTVTGAKPEVGWMRCSATLIHPRYVLTARHCWPEADAVPAGVEFHFTNSSGLVDIDTSPSVTVDRVKTLGPEDAPRTLPTWPVNAKFFNTDVLIARLTSAVAASTATPALIATAPELHVGHSSHAGGKY